MLSIPQMKQLFLLSDSIVSSVLRSSTEGKQNQNESPRLPVEKDRKKDGTAKGINDDTKYDIEKDDDDHKEER